MKCSFPKAFIDIDHRDTSLIDACIKQLRFYNEKYDLDLPIVLMTSFNTHLQLDEFAKQYSGRFKIELFEQSVMPRIYAESHFPIPNINLKNSEQVLDKNEYLNSKFLSFCPFYCSRGNKLPANSAI